MAVCVCIRLCVMHMIIFCVIRMLVAAWLCADDDLLESLYEQLRRNVCRGPLLDTR